MASDPSLDHLIARVLIDRLLAEPVIGSATAEAIVASLLEGDGAHYTRLASKQSLEIVAALPPDQRTHIEGHLLAIGDRTEIGVARYGLSVEALGREIERLRKEKALGDLAAADKARIEAEIALQISQRISEIGSGCGPTLPIDRPTIAESSPQPIDDRPPLNRGKKRPLWSAVEAGFIREKSRSADGHKGYDQQTVRQTEITLYLWRELVGDRPIDQYSGEDAGEFRDLTGCGIRRKFIGPDLFLRIVGCHLLADSVVLVV